MSFDKEKLYALLPAVYRLRDDEQGKPLKALLSVIAEQVAVLEEDLEQLYDDQFIETCAEWVVPYIGDLVGARGLQTWPEATFSHRAQVANTLAYRRRKGTAAMLEQLARDVTGWPSNVVEFFELLSTTQYMNHIRLRHPVEVDLRGWKALHPATVDLRDWEALELLDTPFERLAHTADVRHIETRRGLYNIPNVAIFLWRLAGYLLTDAPAHRLDARRFRFNPLGFDTPLYNRTVTEKEITHLAETVNVPAPLRRRLLERDLELHYGANQSFHLKVDDVPIDADAIRICNLSDDGAGWLDKANDKHVVDPVLGRIMLPEGVYADPAKVRVSFRYGFSAEMGGGQYGRASTFTNDLEPLLKVPTHHAMLQDALDNLDGNGVVEIENNEYYFEQFFINAAADGKVELRAADERRPVIAATGDFWITGGDGSEVTLNGLVLAGGTVRVPLEKPGGQPNELRVLRISHCTLLPGATPAIGNVPAQSPTVRIRIDAPNVTVEIDRSIVGMIRAVEGARVRITDSILDAGAESSPAYADPALAAGASLHISNSTVVGRVHTELIEASNTIFMSGADASDPSLLPLRVERLQEGCVRFSYVPPGSRVPRQYHCQPLQGDTAEQRARVRPLFESLTYGDAAYCQLSPRCAAEIRQGADDEAAMGAFHHLYEPLREANLRARLDEYLRFGLEAGIIYAS
ncbi:MAG TPA: hypothetical protein VGB76_10340 [Pyrinomonadaceae bacterium]|jgi:hypothetical protein